MSDLKMLNSTKYLYKLTFIKCSYEPVVILLSSSLRAMKFVLLPDGLPLVLALVRIAGGSLPRK